MKKNIVIGILAVLVVALAMYAFVLKHAQKDSVQDLPSTSEKTPSSKSVTPFSVNSGFYAGYTTYSDAGEFAVIKDGVLSIVGNGQDPKKVANLPADGDYTYPSISTDGKRIAYFKNTQFLSKAPNTFNPNPSIQLWTVNNDGTDQKMIADLTGKYSLTQYGLFPLKPVAWSADSSEMYVLVLPGRDHGATSGGMIAINMTSGAIEKTAVPNVVSINNVTFSPDKSKVAYITFVPGEYYTDWKSPYTIGITNLDSSSNQTVIQSNTDSYVNLIWSPDGKNLAYSFANSTTGGIYLADIASLQTSKMLSQNGKVIVQPIAWLSSDKLAYESIDSSKGGDFGEHLMYSINKDGSGNALVGDNGGEGAVLPLLGIKK